MECQLGSNAQAVWCLFDTSTSITGTFDPSFTDYAKYFYDSSTSDTSHDYGITVKYNSIGLTWTGVKTQDTLCLGNGDVHITVCLDKQDFVYITK